MSHREKLPAIGATRRRKALALLVTGLVAGAAGAQPANTSTAVVPQNVIHLSASGALEVAQDLLTVSLTTTRDGADVGTVQNELKVALDAALAEAKRAAQPGLLDVRTGHFGLSPLYGRDGRISGWRGSAELVLEGRDVARISATAGKIQTLSVASTVFSLSREQRVKVESDAQAMAIERFKAKATDIARSFGFGSYTLREIAVNGSEPGPVSRPRLMAMEAKAAAAEAPLPTEAGRSTVQVNVSGTVQLLK